MEETAPATKADLKAFATKDDLKAFATKDDLKVFATKEDLKDLRQEMREGFTGLNQAIDQVLLVMTNVDRKHTKVAKSHGKRILKLEKLVGIEA